MLATKLFIFYFSHLIWPYILFGILYTFKGQKLPWTYFLVLALGLVLAYARFVEPSLLIVRTTEVQIAKKLNQDLTIAVFSDTHFGIFKNAVSAERITAQVNNIKPDLVLIPGDFLYELDPQDIQSALAGFKNLKAQAYAVTGNHDEQAPGPDYGDLLTESLKINNIKVLNNSSSAFSDELQIIGLSDLWAGHYDSEVLNELHNDKLNILLSHNPDMAYKLKPNKNIDLIVAGHTHGGQVRLPWIYKRMIPSKFNFDKGLYFNQNSYQVFVTSGTGMVGLPFRFLMPPRIDVLKIKGKNWSPNKSNKF